MALSLVTGGAGFVGRHLVEALAARGESVRVLDLAEAPGLPRGVEYRRASVTDRAAFDAALRGVDTLYHLAGIAHLWRRDVEDFDRANRIGTETAIAAAEGAGTRRVVHCSTESILLPPRRTGAAVDESSTPSVEEMPGPYTRSKLRGEQAALAAARRGLNLVVVNPTVPVGVGDRNMTPPAAMLELFLAGKSPAFLDCVLNLVDVRDLAEGIIAAGERGRVGERYILGGENVALRALLPALERKSGVRMPRRAVPAALALATGTVAGWWATHVTGRPPAATREAVLVALRSAPFDSGKARRDLGYAPRPIDGALTDVVEAFKRKARG